MELTVSPDEDNDSAPGVNDATERLLGLVQELGNHAPAMPTIAERIGGIVIGRLMAVQPSVRVAWAGAPEGVQVRCLVPLTGSLVGREVALMFEGQDPARPIVTGVVELLPVPDAEPLTSAQPLGLAVEITSTKERHVLSAPDELVLRCGKASITLTKAGKILIRGAYVSSTATGTHRIRGGSVEIN